jgi:predicted dehydrogenase
VNIVLVGCGRQARLHVRSLARLRETFDLTVVGVVDPDPQRARTLVESLSSLGLSAPQVHVGLELREVAQVLDLSTAVVDVVTTNSVHHEVAACASAGGALGIVIEKPIADTVEHARCIRDLQRPVFILENYLFSAISCFTRTFLRERNLTPGFAKTEFSKDRRRESMDGRGVLADYVPHVFDVEIPHQVALMTYLLGPVESVRDAWCNDMILGDGRIADHGEGAITVNHGNGVTSYNFSCLQGYHHLSTTYRTARIYCDDGTNVFCYYPSTLDLSGSVLVYRGERLLERHAFSDDSLTEALRYSLGCCRDEASPVNDVSFGCSVLDVITAGKQLATVYR